MEHLDQGKIQSTGTDLATVSQAFQHFDPPFMCSPNEFIVDEQPFSAQYYFAKHATTGKVHGARCIPLSMDAGSLLPSLEKACHEAVLHFNIRAYDEWPVTGYTGVALDLGRQCVWIFLDLKNCRTRPTRAICSQVTDLERESWLCAAAKGVACLHVNNVFHQDLCGLESVNMLVESSCPTGASSRQLVILDVGRGLRPQEQEEQLTVEALQKDVHGLVTFIDFHLHPTGSLGAVNKPTNPRPAKMQQLYERFLALTKLEPVEAMEAIHGNPRVWIANHIKEVYGNDTHLCRMPSGYNSVLQLTCPESSESLTIKKSPSVTGFPASRRASLMPRSPSLRSSHSGGSLNRRRSVSFGN